MFTFLGDVRQAIVKIRQYVESESAFFNAFLEEGLRFSSSLYLTLIWVRVLKYIFQNPSQVAEKMKKSHPCFQEFLIKQTTEAYIDGLCESLKSVCIGSPVKKPGKKRRLSDILSQETSSDDEPPRRRHLSDTEDDDVPSTSHLSYGEVERTSSSLSKKISKKKKKSKKQ